jgi:hypothetical protein
MENVGFETTLGDWLRRYGSERPYRQQAAAVIDRLTDEFPAVFLAAAPRQLTEAELDEVVKGMLAYGELLVAGVANRRECQAAAA